MALGPVADSHQLVGAHAVRLSYAVHVTQLLRSLRAEVFDALASAYVLVNQAAAARNPFTLNWAGVHGAAFTARPRTVNVYVSLSRKREPQQASSSYKAKSLFELCCACYGLCRQNPEFKQCALIRS